MRDCHSFGYVTDRQKGELCTSSLEIRKGVPYYYIYQQLTMIDECQERVFHVLLWIKEIVTSSPAS